MVKDLVLKREQFVIKSFIIINFNQIEYKESSTIGNQLNNYFIASIKTIRDNIENVNYIEYL